jgi:uncharacterized MAPEG superfamily protein
MTTELTILATYGLVVLLSVAAQATVSLTTERLGWLAGPRDEPGNNATAGARLKRATDNSVVAMAYFAPAVLMLHLTGATSATTLLAAQVFLVCRILYVVLYALGTPWIRTLLWVVAFVAALYLNIAALT